LANLALSPLAIQGLLPLTFAGVGTRDLIAFYQPYFNAQPPPP